MNRAFKVIQGYYPYWCQQNPEQIVVVMYNNVDLISDTYEDTDSNK